jgi:hypothetical protein
MWPRRCIGKKYTPPRRRNQKDECFTGSILSSVSQVLPQPWSVNNFCTWSPTWPLNKQRESYSFSQKKCAIPQNPSQMHQMKDFILDSSETRCCWECARFCKPSHVCSILHKIFTTILCHVHVALIAATFTFFITRAPSGCTAHIFSFAMLTMVLPQHPFGCCCQSQLWCAYSRPFVSQTMRCTQ